MSFTLTGILVVNCPEAAAGDFVTRLDASVPADVTDATGDVDEKFPGPVSGNFPVAANFSATVSQDDIGSLVNAVMAAVAADHATLVSLNLKVAAKAA